MTKNNAYDLIKKTFYSAFGYYPCKNSIQLFYSRDDDTCISFIVGHHCYELTFDYDYHGFIIATIVIRDFYGYGHDLNATVEIY